MKSKLLVTILFFTAVCRMSSYAQVKWQKESVTISGKVLNFEKHKDHSVINFYFKDLINRNSQNVYATEIDGKGSFFIKVPLLYPQDFYLTYGSRINLLCTPGDSLFLNIDADIFNDFSNESPNGHFFVRITKGNRIKDNTDLMSFMQGLPRKAFYAESRDEALIHKLPADFILYITGREKEYRNYWNEFQKSNKTTSLFNKWVEEQLKYETLADLMTYPSCYARENMIAEDSVKLPDNYYALLKTYNMNDCQFFSTKHADFLSEYYRFVLKNPGDSASKAHQLFKKQEIVAGAQILLRMIRQNTSGFTRNLILTKFYLDAIEGNQLKEFEALYDSRFITDPFFKNIISFEHVKLKKFMANQVTDGANLITIKSSVAKNVIDTILTKYKDKVVYIDFWAPWCSPCMFEMPYSKFLQKEFKNRDVIFLYLANRCSEESWKATIANDKLTGEHILLTDDQFKVLSAEFGISGIPHYVLIDKKGNIVSKSAARPSQKELLIKFINDIL